MVVEVINKHEAKCDRVTISGALLTPEVPRAVVAEWLKPAVGTRGNLMTGGIDEPAPVLALSVAVVKTTEVLA